MPYRLMSRPARSAPLVVTLRFLSRPALDDQNGSEIIQIGWSQMKARPNGSLIQDNTFEQCDGENEIITVKASDGQGRGRLRSGRQRDLRPRRVHRHRVCGLISRLKLIVWIRSQTHARGMP